MIIALIAIVMILILIGLSIYSFITDKVYQRSYFSGQIFATLALVYLVVLIGFGFIYFWLSLYDFLLIESKKPDEQYNMIETFAHAFYFSGVTLMTVGYGDITPIGWGRVIALVEALIGYILPGAFIFKIGQHMETFQANKKAPRKK